MPIISFTVVERKRKSVKTNLKLSSKTKRTKNKSIIEKDITGIVDLTDDIKYVVILKDGRHFLIDKSCFNCKGHKNIYSQILVGEYKQVIVIDRLHTKHNHFPYLPFCVGCIVNGNIVKYDNGRIRFIIKKCVRDTANFDAIDVIKRFKEIYNDELEKAIIETYNTVYNEL